MGGPPCAGGGGITAALQLKLYSEKRAPRGWEVGRAEGAAIILHRELGFNRVQNHILNEILNEIFYTSRYGEIVY